MVLVMVLAAVPLTATVPAAAASAERSGHSNGEPTPVAPAVQPVGEVFTTARALAPAGPSKDGPDADPSILAPQDLAVAANGTIWFTNTGGNSIGRIVNGSASTVGTMAGPRGIAEGPGGALFITGPGTANLVYVDPVTAIATPIGGGKNFGELGDLEPIDGLDLAPGMFRDVIGPGGTGPVGPGLLAIRSAGGSGYFVENSPSALLSGPQRVAQRGGIGWAANASGTIVKITQGSAAVYSDGGVGTPRGIAIDADGSAWFTTGSKIGRVTVGGTFTYFTDPNIGVPADITAGPDGAMWFSNPPNGAGTATIGRISAEGAVTTYPTPSNIRPSELVFALDGSIWFTSILDNSIGHLQVRPGAPSGVSALAGAGQAGVSWTAPTFTGGGPITGYEVTPNKAGVAQAPINFDGSATLRTITGLTANVAYTFTVRAVTAVGSGPSSSASNPVTPTTVYQPPSLDNFANAAAISSGTPPKTFTLSNLGATQEPNEPVPTGKWGGASIWASFTPDANGRITASTCGTGFDTVMGIYTGSSLNTLTLVGEDDDSCGDGNARITSNVVAGTKYLIEIDGYLGAQGYIRFSWTYERAPDAPTAVSATGGFGAATVSWTRGTDPNAVPTGYVVTPYLGATAQTPVVFDTVATTQRVPVPFGATTYTFKVAAKNALGTSPKSAASNAVPVKFPFAPFSSWTAYVARQYQDVWAKAPSSTSLASWLAQLQNETKTPGQLVEALRRGSENTTNVDPVARLYRAFLQRTPDAGGLTFWVKRRRTGAWTLNRMAQHFATSSEFTRKYGPLSNRAFVTRIYTDVLERSADPGGVDYWTKQLDLRRRTRGSVMVGFSESNEYKRKQVENTDSAVAYIMLLGRAPSTAEVQHWVSTEKSDPASHDDLLTELLRSESYATHILGS